MGLFLGSNLVSPAEIVNTGGGGSDTKFGLSLDNFVGNVTNGVLGAPNAINGITFTGVTNINNSALEYSFYKKNVRGTISFPALTTVNSRGLYDAFANNQITAISFPLLKSAGDNSFNSAFMFNQISLISFPELTIINRLGFKDGFKNNQITSVSFPKLSIIGNNGFNNAFANNQITSVSFPSLTTISKGGFVGAFSNNIDPDTDETTLQSISFPALTSEFFGDYEDNIFSDMLVGNTGVTVHFPSNLEVIISDWDDIINKFGGDDITILFDLPATE
jgi:hypothetical protein